MNNELNMVLKAKVVKLRVELDIKGSALPTQVNKITKYLRDNGSKVKLKVELVTTVKEMNEQLNKIRTLAASKPIKVRIDVDTKGAAQIKDSLNRVDREMKNFNKNYAQQARVMTASKQKVQKAMTIEKVPTSAGVANMNFIKQYTKQAQEAERILRSKLPPNKDGIFSTKQFKNAQGDMTSFVATLKRTDGIIESVRYRWNAKKEMFVPISRTTLNNSQQALNKTRQTLATMTPKIEAELRKLVSYGKLTSEQFDRAMAQLPRTAKRNVENLNKQLNALRATNSKIQNEINSGQIKIMAGAGSSTANGLKGMLGAGNMGGIQREIERLKGASVQGIQATDKLGSHMTTLKVRMASTGKTAETLTMQLNRVTGELRQVGAASIDFNPNRNLGFFEQLRVAMARVPIWMVAMTAFYGSIRAVRSAVTEILKVDKALTELKRVASDNINIDTMFRGSVDLSKELGNNVHEILNSVAELARTFGDFNERQLLAITRTGTLMANVSDLNAEEAVQSLVGTMNAFNIEAEESIRIVDSLNEVDNNFAISTKQLSEGLSKSASTAKTFGVEMEESIGHITAIGSVTMESGRLIGNSLKTIYSRITTLKASRQVLEGIGIEMTQIGKNGVEDVRPVNDILTDLADRWFTLSDTQRQNIAVQVAGRYQLSRFLALMNNWDTATKATETAIYSQGSAMRENAEYMKSFEARINILKNSWTELALAIGDAFLKGAMMEVIRGFTAMAAAMVKVVDTVGVMPILLGGIGLVMLKMGMFSKSVRGIVGMLTNMQVAFATTGRSAGMMGGAMARSTAVASVGFGALRTRAAVTAASIRASMAAALTSVRTFSTGFKIALASTGIGALFVGVGIAIEKLMSAYNKKKEKEQELIKLNDKMVDSYRQHRDGMDGLVARYEELSGKASLSVDEQKEMLGIQKNLAEQIPTTVSYIDANGKAHMKTTTEIKREIQAVKDLSQAEAELTNAKFEETMEKRSKAYMKIIENVEDLNKKQKLLYENDGKNAWTNGNAGVDNMNIFKPTIDNDINIQKNKVEILMAEAEKTQAIQKTVQAVQDQAVAYFEAGNKMSAIGDGQRAVIEQFIGYNEAMLRHADTPEKFEQAYRDLFEIGVQVGEVFVDAYDIMSKDIEDDPLKLGELKKDLGEVAKAIPDTFYQMTDEFGKPIKSIEEIESGLKDIINVSNRVAKGDNNWDGLVEDLQDAGLTAREAEGFLNGLATSHENAALRAEAQSRKIDGTTESLEDLNEQAMEAIDLQGALFGMPAAEIEGVKTYLQLMHLIVDTQGEAGKKSAQYMDAQVALTDYLGITGEELDKNKDKYFAIADALGELQLADYDTSMSWKKFIESQDITDAQKKILIAWDGTKNIITGQKTEIIDANEEMAKSQGKVQDVFAEEIPTNSAVLAIQETRKEAEDVSWVKKYSENTGGMFKGFIKGLDEFDAGLRNLPERIMGGLGNVGDTIAGWFSDVRFDEGLMVWGDDMVAWSNSMPERIEKTLPKWADAFMNFQNDTIPEWNRGFDKWGDAMVDWMNEMPIAMRKDLGVWTDAINDWLDVWTDSINNWIDNDSPDWVKGMDRWGDEALAWFQGMPEHFNSELRGWSDAINQWYVDNTPQWMRGFDEWGDGMTEWFGEVPVMLRESLQGWDEAIEETFSDGDSVDWMAITNSWDTEIDKWMEGLPERHQNQWDEWEKTLGEWYMGHVETISTSLEGWGDEFGKWFDGLPSRFQGQWNNWEESLSGWYMGHVDTISTAMEEWWKPIGEWFESLPVRTGEALSKWAVAILLWFSEQNELNKEAYAGWLASLVIWLEGVPAEITKSLVLWTDAMTTWAKDEAGEWTTRLAGWGLSFTEFITQQTLDFLIGLEEFKTSVSEWFVEKKDTLVTGFALWGAEVNTFLDELPEKTIVGLAKMQLSVTEWFTEKKNTLISGMALWGEETNTFFEDWSEGINEGLGSMWVSVSLWFKDKQKSWAELLAGWWAEIYLWFTKLGSSKEIKAAGSGIVATTKDGIEENKDDILEKIAEVILDIPKYVMQAAGILLFALGREIIERMIDGTQDEKTQEDWKNSFTGLITSAMLAMVPLKLKSYLVGKNSVEEMDKGVEDAQPAWRTRVGLLVTIFAEAIKPLLPKAKETGEDAVDEMGKGVDSGKPTWKNKWDAIKGIAVTKMKELAAAVVVEAGKIPGLISTALKKSSAGVLVGIASLTTQMGIAISSGLNNKFVVPVNAVLSFLRVPASARIPMVKLGGGGSNNSAGGKTSSGSRGGAQSAYAKGTKRRKHGGGEALVGEEGPELAHIPNQGVTVVGQQGAEVIDLPQGSSVLPHKETRMMLKRYSFPEGVMPAYATGVGDFFTKYFGNPKQIITNMIDAAKFNNPFSGGIGSMVSKGAGLVKNGAINYAVDKIKSLFTGDVGDGKQMGTGGNIAASFGSLRKTSDFGYRIHPIYKTSRLHAGVDYAGPVGTAIKAQVGGRVSQSGPSGTGFGTMVKITNGMYSYIYAHLSKAIARVGSTIGKGNILGLLGNTGASTGPHLHYEVHKNGRPIKPNVKGFARGGEVRKEQIIRVGEQDKAEMIIPLEQHRGRAESLWKEAGERLGMFQYFATGGTVGKSSYTDRADAYKRDNFSLKSNAFKSIISAIEGAIASMTKESINYRDSLAKIIATQQEITKLEQGELKRLQTRNTSISKSLKALPTLSKQTTAQRETYNNLMQEFDDNTGKIESLKLSVADLVRDTKEKTAEIFTNLIDELVVKYDKAIKAIEGKLDNIDFNIGVAEALDPKNMEKALELQAQKAIELQKQQDTARNKYQSLNAQYGTAAKKYGTGSTQAKYALEARDASMEEWEDAKLAVLAAEKEIKDIRASIADAGIDTLRDFYTNMKDMATQAIDAEVDALEKAHEKKINLLDEEAEKINSVYDERLKQMDKVREEENYSKDLAEKNSKRAELMNKIALASRDSSPEGRKRLAEMQAELAEVNKEISDFTRERQDELMKEAIEKQRQEQLDKIESEKTAQQVILDDKLVKLEEQKVAVEKQYEDLLNNDKYWADMRNQFIAGSFTQLNTELTNMKSTLDNMNRGIFDGLFAGFTALSVEVKKQIAELSALNIDNMLFNSKDPISDVKETVAADPYKFSNGGTSGTGSKAPTPVMTTPKPAPKPAAPAPKPAPSTGTTPQYYTIQKGDTFSEIEQRYKLPFGSLQKLNPNLDPRRLQIGQRIVLKKGTSTPAPSTSTANRMIASAVNFRSSAGYGNNVITTLAKGAKVQYLGMEKGWAKIKSGTKTGYVGSSFLKSFDTGGYTGEFGKEGRIGILHEKELVLKQDDTRNVLDVVKNVREMLTLKRTNVAGNFAASGQSIVNNNNMDVNINIENMNGNKADIKYLAKEVASELHKTMRKDGY